MNLLQALTPRFIAAVLTGSILSLYANWVYPQHRRRRIRAKLPSNLQAWRLPGPKKAEEQIWKDLNSIFHDAGFTLWLYEGFNFLRAPDNANCSTTGFGFVVPFRLDPKAVGGLRMLRIFEYANPLCRAASTRDGLAVVVRIIAHGDSGHGHLKILRRIATAEDILYTNNHALPMLQEFLFEDLVFGIFPKVGAEVCDVYGAWAKNSVGDVVGIIIQMLEALAFIHQRNVAHRDAFHDNFLVQWHPESLATKKISTSTPRVYLTDFEVAVEFPAECPAEDRLCNGLPINGSFSLEKYSRPHAPELQSGKSYNPFKLDIWQLGTCFSQPRFKTNFSSIDQVLMDLTVSDPVYRLDAQEALDRLTTAFQTMTPESLLIPPSVQT